MAHSEIASGSSASAALRCQACLCSWSQEPRSEMGAADQSRVPASIGRVRIFGADIRISDDWAISIASLRARSKMSPRFGTQQRFAPISVELHAKCWIGRSGGARCPQLINWPSQTSSSGIDKYGLKTSGLGYCQVP